MPPETRYVVKPDVSLWNELLKEEDYPSFLLKSAKGNFSPIEKYLNEKGVEIPESLRVDSMLAIIALGAAQIINEDLDQKKVDFNAKQPHIALILGNSFSLSIGGEEEWKTPRIRYRVSIKGSNITFNGEIRTPEYEEYEEYHHNKGIGNGIPHARIKEDEKMLKSPSLSQEDFFTKSSKSFTKKGRRLCDFIGSQIDSFEKSQT